MTTTTTTRFALGLAVAGVTAIVTLTGPGAGTAAAIPNIPDPAPVRATYDMVRDGEANLAMRHERDDAFWWERLA